MSPNIVSAFCMMYARLLTPNASLASGDHYFPVIVSLKTGTADQAVFLYVYNAVNTKSLPRLNFSPPSSFTCLKS